MTRVKICGNTHAEDVALCVEAGADAVGVVVEYPIPVPWNVSRQQAERLLAGVPPFVERVAVAGGSAETLVAIAEATGASALQLHLDEPESVVEEVARRLDGRVRLVKALRVDVEDERVGADALVRAVRRFRDAGADAVLLDAKTGARPAGTGHPVDRALARQVVAAAPLPVLLAGGLAPENVAGAIAAVGPFGVDVISGVEDDAHRKVAERVRAFVAAAHRR